MPRFAMLSSSRRASTSNADTSELTAGTAGVVLVMEVLRWVE